LRLTEQERSRDRPNVFRTAQAKLKVKISRVCRFKFRAQIINRLDLVSRSQSQIDGDKNGLRLKIADK
jgi:hypothetical protein